ncbi:MAG: hypothetical protein JWQ62_722 [Lacunisphaera sp.]|nr:hypothetical protein [Lacunisphaera sp.]
MKPRAVNHIALVGDYPPRQCGIATFSIDVRRAITSEFPQAECFVVPVTDPHQRYAYPPEVRFEIEEQDVKSYQRAADFINFSDAEVVSLQHEFGIYGGEAGSHVLTLLRELHIPVISHLHTVVEHPEPAAREVLEEILRRSARVIVMTQRGREILQEVHGMPADRIDLIPHGIPDMPFVDPDLYKGQFDVEGRKVLLTFGLLVPNKGIEYMIQALPEIVKAVPSVVYIVLGATHPALLRAEGDTYRLKLERMVAKLGLNKHVVFYDRFVDLKELKEFLGAADVYVTPYLGREQITSGTLAYAFGCGKAVVSTPYLHAAELLADGRGVLVPFADSPALARAISSLLRDEPRLLAMREQAHRIGRGMIWSNVAHQYMASYQKARLESVPKRLALKTLEQEPYRLPGLQLEHLRRLCDGTGILHHAIHGVPDFSGGYRTTDNAQALRLAVLLEETGNAGPDVSALAATCAAFLGHAFVPRTGRFRQHLAFERTWLDDAGDDDALGAAVWALGTCVGRAGARTLQRWAARLLEHALPALGTTTSPSAWAMGLLGIQEYCRRLSGDRVAEQMQTTLVQRLLGKLAANERSGWTWFEFPSGPGTATLSHALLLGGQWAGRDDAVTAGLRSLRWLLARQTTAAGHFRAIGPTSDVAEAGLDQFPAEAAASVAACIEAFACTGDPSWMAEAHRAFEWFLGRNDLGEPLCEPATGGCYDALHRDRLNLNQGAEATLAFLLSLQEMRLRASALHAFRQPVDSSRMEARSFVPPAA